MSMVSGGAGVCLCLYLLTVTLHSQAPAAAAAWKDPSPHRTQFVQVTPPVRLEVLDWGGTGKPLMLLAGGGDTAHVFDDFAPKLLRDRRERAGAGRR